MSGKLTALTYSTYTVRHEVTLKWLPIVFVRLIQSQRIVTVTAKYDTTSALRDCGYPFKMGTIVNKPGFKSWIVFTLNLNNYYNLYITRVRLYYPSAPRHSSNTHTRLALAMLYLVTLALCATENRRIFSPTHTKSAAALNLVIHVLNASQTCARAAVLSFYCICQICSLTVNCQ
jgi:hypothetical protein